MQQPPEEPDLDRVREYFRDRGLEATRLPEADTPTPDFRVLRNSDLVAFCEVKSPNDPWLDNLAGGAEPFRFVGGSRSDPIFNRLSRQVKKAASQFRAVNADRSILNILAIVNHDDASHIGDLLETLTGQFHAADGERIPTMPHMVERLGEDRTEIDVYLWFCAKTDRLAGYFVTLQPGDPRLALACSLLQIDPMEIQRTPA